MVSCTVKSICQKFLGISARAIKNHRIFANIVSYLVIRKLRECQIWNKRYRFLSVEVLDIYGKDSALFYDILAA